MKWVAAMTLAVSFNVQAEFYTGNDLLNKLNSDSTIDRALALGYIAGVSDYGTNVVNCLPKGITLGQLKDLVQAHLINNPASRHFSADSIITNLLQRTWPCAPRGRSS